MPGASEYTLERAHEICARREDHRRRRHVVLLRGYLHKLLDLCLTLSEELQEIVAPKT